MSRTTLILAPDAARWRCAVVRDRQVEWHELESGLDAPAAAASVAELARGMNATSIGLMPPSSWCLTATLTADQMPASGGRQALLYALEEHLPLPLEELALQILGGAGGAMAVGVALNRIQPVIDALRMKGLSISVVIPAALAAWTQLVPRVDDGLAVLSSGSEVDLLRLERGRLGAWSVAGVDAPSLTAALGWIATDASALRQIVVVGLDDAARSMITAATGMHTQSIPGKVGDLAAIGTAMAASRPRSAIVDLLPAVDAVGQRGGASRRTLTLALCGMIFVLSAVGAMWLRAGMYDRVYLRHKSEQDAYFEARFRKPPPPAGIVRIFESELAAAKSGGGVEVAGRYDSAVRLLRHTLSRMPESARVRIRSIRVTTDRVELKAQAATRADAYAAEKALAELPGFHVEITDIQDAGSEDGVLAFTLIASGQAASTAGAAP
jgi:hypothetical protein